MHTWRKGKGDLREEETWREEIHVYGVQLLENSIRKDKRQEAEIYPLCNFA